MTPAARYAAAIDILDRWSEGLPAEVALTRWARGARYAGSKDRAAVRDHVYDILRCKGSAAALGGAETGRALVLGLLRLQGIDPETVFTGDGHAPALLDATETEQLQGDVTAELDIPAWTRPFFSARFGDATATIYAEFQSRAPVYLRVNLGNATPQSACEALAADSIAAAPVSGSDSALMVTEGARRIRASAAYLSGLVELQDLSVQQAVARLEWPDGARVLDYCAGAGGKALAIAARADVTLDAHDAAPERMADLPERARRAGVRIERKTAAQVHASAPYDIVLCDVPCSGSGTWRRDPEAKWRLTPERLDDLTGLQAQILQEAATLVAPTGRLIYMTCSLFGAENEDQAARFCVEHPDWRLVATHVDTPLTASDGFFTADFDRKP